MVDAVRNLCGVPAGLKWPNDALVGSEKLAGILAKVAPPFEIVVGIGLIVTLTSDEVPHSAATSLVCSVIDAGSKSVDLRHTR